MEAIYFSIFWLGGALLHTWYDLKGKFYLKEFKQKSAGWTDV